VPRARTASPFPSRHATPSPTTIHGGRQCARAPTAMPSSPLPPLPYKRIPSSSSTPRATPPPFSTCAAPPPPEHRPPAGAAASISSPDAPPSLPSPQVNFSWPPLHFGSFPSRLVAGRPCLSAAGEPASEPPPPVQRRRRLYQTRRRPFACKHPQPPDLSRRLRSIQAAPVNRIILVNPRSSLPSYRNTPAFSNITKRPFHLIRSLQSSSGFHVSAPKLL
jgi:hypothetical protein